LTRIQIQNKNLRINPGITNTGVLYLPTVPIIEYSTYRSRVEMGGGCICPLSWSVAYTTTPYVMVPYVDTVKGGGRAPPLSLGWADFLHHNRMYTRMWPLPLCVHFVDSANSGFVMQRYFGSQFLYRTVLSLTVTGTVNSNSIMKLFNTCKLPSIVNIFKHKLTS
jgi:hypothetical protein